MADVMRAVQMLPLVALEDGSATVASPTPIPTPDIRAIAREEAIKLIAAHVAYMRTAFANHP